MPMEGKAGKAALIYRTVGFLVSTVGLAMHLLADRVTAAGFMVKHQLAYFTIQTNIFAAVLFGLLVLQALLDHRQEGTWQVETIHPSVHLALTLYLTITMLGYWLLLVPATGLPPQPYLLCSTMILHTVTPLLLIVDQAVFGDHGKVPFHEVGCWLWYPAVYLVFVMVYSQTIREPYYSFRLGDRVIDLMYPYPFLDAAVVGTWGVIGAAAGLAIIFILLGLLFIFLDRRLASK